MIKGLLSNMGKLMKIINSSQTSKDKILKSEVYISTDNKFNSLSLKLIWKNILTSFSY